MNVEDLDNKLGEKRKESASIADGSAGEVVLGVASAYCASNNGMSPEAVARNSVKVVRAVMEELKRWDREVDRDIEHLVQRIQELS